MHNIGAIGPMKGFVNLKLLKPGEQKAFTVKNA